jgi:nitrate reductase gamma subunit
MNELYDFLSGPALWAAFIVFVIGLVVRVAYLFGVSKELDRVFYNHVDLRWALRSIIHWLVPLGSVSMRAQPLFSIAFFVFHICLFGVPLFLLAHNTLWQEAFGIRIPAMPDFLADILTVVFIVAAIILLVRRVVRPEVRILTTAWDYFLILLTSAPFLTGFLAYHQLGPYKLMLILHILFSEILLVLIPFSKLGHIILFFPSRAFIGFEMGSRRGVRTW